MGEAANASPFFIVFIVIPAQPAPCRRRRECVINKTRRNDLVRKALALLVIVAMVGAVTGAVGLLYPHPAGAHEHSAARSFGSAEVAAGGDLEVTITVNDFGNAASVVETLPEGFDVQEHQPAGGPGEG